MKWFKSLSRGVQIIILIIPLINWIIELIIRWSQFATKGKTKFLLMAIIATLPTSVALGWIDAIWLLANKRITVNS